MPFSVTSSSIFFFQHESLSVKMFMHLLEQNNLNTHLMDYFHEDLNRDIMFIKELIEGPLKDEAQVHGQGISLRFL